MNARDGLERIRERLWENDAQTATLQLVDDMIKRASAPGADRAQASMLQLVGHLLRTPAAKNNYQVYNDLVRVEEELNEVAERRRAEVAAEESRPMPKSKKYYKQLKDKEKRGA